LEKANPTRLCLVEAFKEGFGFEAASIGELQMSQRAHKSAFVVYDSPLKTLSDLKEAMHLGVAVIFLVEFFFSDKRTNKKKKKKKK
jgi:diaminopimelate decarboxylase